MAEKKIFPDALKLGTLLHGPRLVYKIVEVLGQGGFGITYKATTKDVVGNIPVEYAVAIKEHFIKDENSRDTDTMTVLTTNTKKKAEVAESLNAFIAEARKLYEVGGRSPHIVRVNESFRANGTAYYVMEYIDGISLDGYVRDEYMDEYIAASHKAWEEKALRLISQVGEALATLHDNHMTHLDVKPQNIMLCSDGGNEYTTKLIDFGLAKHYDSEGHATSSMKVAGLSEGYAPMEQYVGINTFTPEADVYALAATLYYMLCGKHPRVASEVSEKYIRDTIPPYFSPRITDAICRAMRQNRMERTHSVREFLHQLTTNDTTDTQARVRGGSATAENTSLSAAGSGNATMRIQPQKDNHTSSALHESSDNSISDDHESPELNESDYSGATTVIGTDNRWGAGNPDGDNYDGGTDDGGSWLSGKIKYILGAAAVAAALVVAVLIFGNGGNKTTQATDGNQSDISVSGSATAGSNATFTVGDVPLTMIWVKGGTFTMGATSEQGSDADDNEKPAHNVTVSDFWIGETEVTQALWQAVMGRNPSEFKGSNRPVENVSWNDCQSFVKKLNSLLSDQLPAGRKFRLPDEAEWEYAARGGNRSGHYKYSGSNNLGSVAWYDDNSGSTTHDVKTKNSNELGIYDMSGNVWEWCQDNWRDNYNASYDASYRVYRGGCWINYARGCRVSLRSWDYPASAILYLGLRLAL